MHVSIYNYFSQLYSALLYMNDSLFDQSLIFGHLDRFRYFAITHILVMSNFMLYIFTLFKVHLKG